MAAMDLGVKLVRGSYHNNHRRNPLAKATRSAAGFTGSSCIWSQNGVINPRQRSRKKRFPSACRGMNSDGTAPRMIERARGKLAPVGFGPVLVPGELRKPMRSMTSLPKWLAKWWDVLSCTFPRDPARKCSTKRTDRSTYLSKITKLGCPDHRNLAHNGCGPFHEGHCFFVAFIQIF